MKSIFTVLLFAILFSSNTFLQAQVKDAQVEETTTAAAAWEKFDGEEYAIEYAPDWKFSQSGQMGTTFVLMSAMESDQDKFGENINLIVQDIKGMGLDLEKYATLSEQQIKTMIENSEIKSSERLEKNGQPFQKVIFTGKQANFDLIFEQYYFIKNEKAYVLTLTFEIDKVEKFQAIGEKMLNSFTLK
ncbi:MAG: hypothetical protein AB8G15_07305 [Saprospiraceae bacterium]